MTMNFGSSQSTVMPKLLDMDSSATTVFIRRNIKEVTKTEEGREPETLYIYEECQLSREEYLQWRNEQLEIENEELRNALIELAARVEEVNTKTDETSNGLIEVAGMVASIYSADVPVSSEDDVSDN